MKQLHNAGIAENQIQRAEKSAGWDPSHAIPKRKETNEEMKPDFADPGISTAEARYYEAGYVLLVVHPGEHHQKAVNILKSNGAYNYDTRGAIQPEATGAMTPGMRGEDSTQSGVANTAGGEPAMDIDPATLEADIEHAQQVLQEKYQERKAHGLE